MNLIRNPAAQRGVMLLEALIAILLFSIGILALVGLQAAAIKSSSDAKYRADAAFLANQIIGRMWADNPANLNSYAHHATAGAGACNFGGNASAYKEVTDWLGSTSKPGTVLGTLPGASAANQQISIGAGNIVTVRICWQGPQDPTPHNYVAQAQING